MKALKELLALAFTPVCTLIALWLIWSFMYGPWTIESERLRLIALGCTLGGYVVLQGLGGLWLQGRGIDRVSVKGPGGFEAEVDAERD